ncbi:MAG: F0F1 ATP synthase subunit B [Campylobacterales bacterium]|nr:F0F1 ATP synthase subunit B [Campylobacterales bacterium]
MGKIIITVLMLGVYLFGSDVAHENSTDIVQRTVNFLIFAGILYYLLAEPLKDYFGGRTAGIAGELEKVQERLRESKRLKESAEQKIDEANRFVSELVESTKKECKILSDKISAQCDQDSSVMQKQNNGLMELEKRQMVRNVVNDVMNEVMVASDTAMGSNAMVDILKKKVA